MRVSQVLILRPGKPQLQAVTVLRLAARSRSAGLLAGCSEGLLALGDCAQPWIPDCRATCEEFRLESELSTAAKDPASTFRRSKSVIGIDLIDIRTGDHSMFRE